MKEEIVVSTFHKYFIEKSILWKGQKIHFTFIKSQIH